jgi:hypothetical protein
MSGGWFYYSGFVIANVLFVAMAGALLITNKSRQLRFVVSVVCLLQVLSWLVLSIAGGKSPQVSEIKIGYYLWLSAYALLVAVHLCKEPAESRSFPVPFTS